MAIFTGILSTILPAISLLLILVIPCPVKITLLIFDFIPKYCEDNPEVEPRQLDRIISKVKEIANRMIGVIELSDNLEIDVVTDIFIRINSKGTALSQGDFVMSKIAADEKYGGKTLRKVIDYFSHLAVVPSFYSFIESHDKSFASTNSPSKPTMQTEGLTKTVSSINFVFDNEI